MGFSGLRYVSILFAVGILNCNPEAPVPTSIDTTIHLTPSSSYMVEGSSEERKDLAELLEVPLLESGEALFSDDYERQATILAEALDFNEDLYLSTKEITHPTLLKKAQSRLFLYDRVRQEIDYEDLEKVLWRRGEKAEVGTRVLSLYPGSGYTVEAGSNVSHLADVLRLPLSEDEGSVFSVEYAEQLDITAQVLDYDSDKVLSIGEISDPKRIRMAKQDWDDLVESREQPQIFFPPNYELLRDLMRRGDHMQEKKIEQETLEEHLGVPKSVEAYRRNLDKSPSAEQYVLVEIAPDMKMYFLTDREGKSFEHFASTHLHLSEDEINRYLRKKDRFEDYDRGTRIPNGTLLYQRVLVRALEQDYDGDKVID